MFNTLLKYMSGDETPEQRYQTYMEWQSKQPAIHFHSSEIYDNFLINNPEFQSDTYHTKNSDSINTSYCFGLFNNFVMTGNNRNNIFKLFGDLLSLYDLNKGTMRSLRGDPDAIIILRKSYVENTVEYFMEFDFEPYLYPYHQIHAHTMSQYSLHTLIMRLISHALNFIEPSKNFNPVESWLCNKAWAQGVYGNPTLQSPYPRLSVYGIDHLTRSISNILPTMTSKGNLSLPTGTQPSRELKCSKCFHNATELWSDYDLCYHCFINNFCICCGDQASSKASDGYPRCYIHRMQPVTIDLNRMLRTKK